MLRYAFAILALATSLAQDAPNLAGTWSFTNDDGSSGTIVLHQSGAEFSGTWHTNGSKPDSNTLIAAKLYGNTLLLSRTVSDSQQTYILTLSADRNHLQGAGQGSLNHAKLTMQLLSATPKDASTPPTSQLGKKGAFHVIQNPAASTAPDLTAKTKKQTWMGIGLPPPRGTYSWAIQSVAVHGSKSGKKYSSFYYEVATGRSVEEPLGLPAGGEIVGVFPDDCAFSVQDQAGNSFRFRNESEAQAHGLGPGIWSVYPLKCSGIVVYVR